ncbi:hypothetical protein KB206_08220 [Microvirga sp. STS02]|uniref:hypothetical protein n=1 Tax=Hymenobacter negativus TaxID=2795026 RepID=UPI0018DDDA0E|nr:MULTISPECIES: hypothetical protein [Bacteria]MBH8568864.1 hypothetical protein [Hymenobacter negativus]MBR7208598.1 hypothetical protein [Microvirga sp. STS02]
MPSSPLRQLLPRLGIILALLPFLLLTAFNQPFFDDFRNGYWMREHGTWGVQLWLFQTWTGRFTTTFIMTVLNPVAYGWLGGVKVVAAAAFLAQWASLAHLLQVLGHTVLRRAYSWGRALWAAGLLLALFCNAAPSPFSFLYWFCGIVAYQLPLMGLLNFTALALRAVWGPEATRWRYAGLACLPLVLALTGNELTLVQAVPVLALLAFALPQTARPKLLLWLGIGAAAVALAAVAPGNWARVAAMAPPADPYHAYRWLVLGPRAAYSMLLFLSKPLTVFSVLAAGVAGLWLGRQQLIDSQTMVPLSRRQWAAVLAGFSLLNFIGFLLFRHLVVGPPLPRAQNEIMFVLLLSTAGLGWLVGLQFLPMAAAGKHRQKLFQFLLSLLFIGLIGAGHVPEAWRELTTSAAPFDAQMQARFATLRAAHRAGNPQATLPPLRLRYGRVLAPLRQFSSELEFDIDLTPGCAGNINGVMERYFEVPDVCCDAAAPPLPAAQ